MKSPVFIYFYLWYTVRSLAAVIYESAEPTSLLGRVNTKKKDQNSKNKISNAKKDLNCTGHF